MNNLIVAKFGGSSLADGESIRRVSKIVQMNSQRRVIVLSAPGRRFKNDPKVTDLLLNGQYGLVLERFEEIAKELKCPKSLKIIHKTIGIMKDVSDQEWILSRGEYLMAQIFAEFTGAHFIDSEGLIQLTANREVDPSSYDLIKARLADGQHRVIIPGFYGSGVKKKIMTFPRNGSDITGAVVSRGVGADCYEVWTDVDGVMNCDPNLNIDAKLVPVLTLSEMEQMEAQILHPHAVAPIVGSGIHINIRNTFNPDHPGTKIVEEKA